MEWQTANLPASASAGVAPELPLMRPAERPLFTEVVSLPGGYVDDEGVIHREVELAPVTGFEEELLDSVGPAGHSAQIVTALLARCLRRVGKLAPVTTSLVRDLLINDREFLMLKLRGLTLGKRLRAMIVCNDPKCAQSMDITLKLDDLMPAATHVDRRNFEFEVNEAEETFALEFRLPTGADQEACIDFIGDDSESAIHQLLARIILRVNNNCSIDGQTIRALPA